jgi:hypothetical protein
MKDFNEQGQCLYWKNGEQIGYHDVDYILNSDGSKTMVDAKLKPVLLKVISAANSDGYNLIVDVGVRVFGKQVQLRINNRIEYETEHSMTESVVKGITVEKVLAYKETKKCDPIDLPGITFVLSAESTEFLPPTAEPGVSEHHRGTAIDFRTKKKVNGIWVLDEKLYAWQVNNLYKFKFFRTVKSERWHNSYRPDWTDEDRFRGVLKTDKTWDGFVS